MAGSAASPIGRRELRRRQVQVCVRVGRQIAEARVEAGIGRPVLARASGIQPSYLWKIEAGAAQPSLDVLVAVAACLGSDLGIRLFPGAVRESGTGSRRPSSRR